MKKTAWLFGPVINFEFKKQIKKECIVLGLDDNAPWIVGVDGGVDVINSLRLQPDLIVGDWDSIRTRQTLEGFKNVRRQNLKTNKDRSDFYHALNALPPSICHGVGYGFLGGRLDHSYAVFQDLGTWLKGKRNKTFELASPTEHVVFLTPSDRPHLISLKQNSLFSLFAIGQTAAGVFLKGAKYPLKNARLDLSSRGLSNQVQSGNYQIQVHHKKGVLAIIIPNPYARGQRCQFLQSPIDTAP